MSEDSNETQVTDPTVTKTETVDNHVEEVTATYITKRSQTSTTIDNNVSLFDIGIPPSAPLATALERPVKIHEFLWAVNADFKDVIDPWTLWQENPFVKTKLSNFSYFRCNLNIKIVPSATRFLYGKLLFNYVPYGEDNEIWDNMYTVVQPAAATAVEEAYLQYMSTYPISDYLSAADQNTINLKIPFIWHNNMLCINGRNGLSKETLGLLTWVNFNNLSRANDSVTEPSGMNVSIFAWASDFEMHVPTKLQPTAGKRKKKKFRVNSTSVDEVDEAVGGVLSTTASAVADVASRLEDVPVIGTFARATNIGASAVGNIARLFGFSNPPTIETAQPRVLRLYRNLATTDQPDTAKKLALDSKQELTIDPQVTGAGTNDDMSFAAICAKEQWIGKAAWLGDSGAFPAPGDKVITAICVNPMACRISAPFLHNVNTQVTQLSPAGHLSQLFNNWRGTIVYRIEVVCSDFHGGALQIQFDPLVQSAALANTDVDSTDPNTRMTVIVDIAETREVEIEIPYVNYNVWLKTREITSNTMIPNGYFDNTYNIETLLDDTRDLGVLTVSVLNELTAPGTVTSRPGTGAGVDINVYMHCKDMEFGMPKDGWADQIFVPTSGLLTAHRKKIIAKDENADNDVLTCMGEKVLSVRSLVKREMMTYSDVLTGSPGVGGYLQYLYFPHFAPETLRGFGRRLCYESYFSPCYLLKRGSMRWKTYIFNNTFTSGITNTVDGIMCIQRLNDANPVAASSTSAPLNAIPTGGIATAFPDGSTGHDLTDLKYNPTVDVEVPFYSNTRFALACHITNLDVTSTLQKNPSMNEILYEQVSIHTSGQNTRYITHTSTGEDYNLIMYQAPAPIFTFP